MEPQKTLNSQSNLEKKEQCWRYYVPYLQTVLHAAVKTQHSQKERKKEHKLYEASGSVCLAQHLAYSGISRNVC